MSPDFHVDCCAYRIDRNNFFVSFTSTACGMYGIAVMYSERLMETIC